MLNRLKNALWLIVGAVVAVWAVTSLVGLVRAGPMEPWAPPGSTMKPLDQIEPRTVIWQPGGPGGFPIVISQPGSYYVGENITGVAGKDGIHITTSNVTLDLNGFTVKGGPGSFNGITVPIEASPVTDITIYNGTIRDWPNAGIGADSPNGSADNVHLADLILEGNGGPGVRVNDQSTITRVTALGNGQDGIQAEDRTMVVDSQATDNEGDGIYVGAGSTVRGCTANGNWGVGIEVTWSSLIVGNRADYNAHGIQVTGLANRIEGNSAIHSGVTHGDGIHVTGSGNQIEGNNVSWNASHGVDTSGGDGRNIIIKNSGVAPAADYATHATDTVGPIIVGPVNPIATTNPWANFIY